MDSGQELCLAVVDLDGLKAVNDARGHHGGDEVISVLAGCLAKIELPGQSSYRTGGDEFAVILDGGRAMSGFYVAQNLRGRLEEALGGQVTATVGVAETWTGWDGDELIRRAGTALVAAKRSHRGTLIYAPDLEVEEEPATSEHDDELRRHATTLAASLARAVDAKDAYTHSHCETVAELCALIAQRLGLPPGRVARCAWPASCMTSARSASQTASCRSRAR